MSLANAGHELLVLVRRLTRLPSTIYPIMVNFPTGSLKVFAE
jgi:hypothetical protein